ncbi:hypothetical protein NLJ89_g7919 [Agrocybe chaxingu]|uniref:DUF647-domain-containing protein n=1 Tax=Agrocybe chaxingu TaxID=84603 RepID=A0A9W8JVQ9_9AGAR|nr:hypothetical protein NLJ89_g7919 [Agrocybe chaxingu]
MFLPAGYPQSVSPDYLRYQILNALQAFCNSLASLLSSRAILQGFGVGDPTATPTGALLLTILQDVCSRLTTIFSAHIFGSSLYPEAKTYRLLADILNDTAVILDTLSPWFHTLSIPGLRIFSLCLSAAFKSLCGICAGGSKAAIAIHFSTPLAGKGDIGDLNAKDASKETVLALFGMLLGTLIVPYVTTPSATYTALFILVALHLTINYFGVRGLILRSLNRQRLSIIWITYRKSATFQVPIPSVTAASERIFERSGIIRDVDTHEVQGQCTIGSSFSDILRSPLPVELLDVFDQERYILWFDPRSLVHHDGQDPARSLTFSGLRHLHIFLKEGYTSTDQLRAWVHAVEVCCDRSILADDETDPLEIIRTAHRTISSKFSDFLSKLCAAGWNTDEVAIMTGAPQLVITDIIEGSVEPEAKKTR